MIESVCVIEQFICFRYTLQVAAPMAMYGSGELIHLKEVIVHVRYNQIPQPLQKNIILHNFTFPYKF